MTQFRPLARIDYNKSGHVYDPDSPDPLDDADAEFLLILLHRYFKTTDIVLTDTDVVEDLAMSMDPTTDLADRIRRDLGA